MSEPKKRARGGKLTRSETVTVRLDPKLLYLAELAARKQRRTLSSYIEWAVENSLADVELEETCPEDYPITIENKAKLLWDSDEAERFVQLSINYPELLTFEEQHRWKVIKDSALLDPAKWRNRDGQVLYDPPTLEDHVFPTLRYHWTNLLTAIREGQESTRAFIEFTHKAHKEAKLFPRFDYQKSSNRAPAITPTLDFDAEDELPF